MVHWLARPGLVFSCLVLQPPPRPLSPPSVTHPWTTKIGLACRADATQPGTDHMGPQFRPWVGANSEGRMDGRMGGSSACVSPAKQGLGGGRDALGIVIVSYVSCAGQQTTIDHGSSATDDWRRHQEPRTNRQASKRSVLAGERRRRQRDMVSLNAVGSALAHIPRFGIRIPEQAWLSAAGVRILSQAKPASVSQSVSQPAQTERNEPLLPSAAPPNSNVSGSQPGARLSTTCLRYVAAPVCPK